jgi:hypothetical protein
MAYGQQEKDVLAPRHQLKVALYDSDSNNDTEMQGLMWLVPYAAQAHTRHKTMACNNGSSDSSAVARSAIKGNTMA